MTNLAARYVAWRKQRGRFSQRQLAEDTGVTRTTAERWCSGRQPPSSSNEKRIEAAIKRYERAETRRTGSKVRFER